MSPNPVVFTPEALWSRYGDAVVGGAFNVLSALAILLAGLWITGWLAGAVRRIAERQPRIDNTLAAFFASIVRYGLMAFVLIAVLARFGVETTQMVAVLGAATLAIGLALQGTLSNVAAGVMLILFRPYRLGDFVELNGRRGAVRDINLFVTELATLDNVKITLPNGQCWGAPILNFSANTTRMIELTFNVVFGTDLDKALAILRETVGKDARVRAEPAASVRVTALDGSAALTASLWCNTGEFNAVRLDLLKAVKDAFDAEGVAFAPPPFVPPPAR
jgi:small conductance mechanosensitive channel